MLSLIKVPPVVSIHQVPKVFQEDSILSGYRQPRSSAAACVLSLFQMTNETLNIWSHFLPTWYFVWKLVSVVLLHSSWQASHTWPLLIYLLSVCLYPLASCCAHTFSPMSARARHIGFFWDYAALSFYSLGSAVAYSHYSFPEPWIGGLFHRYYVHVAVVNSVVCTALSCYSRLGLPFLHYDLRTVRRCPGCPRPRCSKALRVLAFAYPYLFDSIPLFYRVFCSDSSVLHVYHIGLAFVTAFLFSSHLPERLSPGRFDYIGHSHQLFHVSAVLGSLVQMTALEEDLRLRRFHSFSVVTSVGAAVFSLLTSVGIVAVFSLALLWERPTEEDKQH